MNMLTFVKRRYFFFTHTITILSLFTYAVCDEKVKTHVNRDAHIAFSPVSQHFSFEVICCFVLASLQRKLRGYIEFKKVDSEIKKSC